MQHSDCSLKVKHGCVQVRGGFILLSVGPDLRVSQEHLSLRGKHVFSGCHGWFQLLTTPEIGFLARTIKNSAASPPIGTGGAATTDSRENPEGI